MCRQPYMAVGCEVEVEQLLDGASRACQLRLPATPPAWLDTQLYQEGLQFYRDHMVGVLASGGEALVRTVSGIIRGLHYCAGDGSGPALLLPAAGPDSGDLQRAGGGPGQVPQHGGSHIRGVVPGPALGARLSCRPVPAHRQQHTQVPHHCTVLRSAVCRAGGRGTPCWLPGRGRG